MLPRWQHLIRMSGSRPYAVRAYLVIDKNIVFFVDLKEEK